MRKDGVLSDQVISRAFRALGHPHRLTIVRALLRRAIACCTSERAEDCRLDAASCNVGDLGRLVEIAPSTLSHHLKELEDAGVIERAREGRYLYCRVNQAMLERLRGLLSGADADGRAA